MNEVSTAYTMIMTSALPLQPVPDDSWSCIELRQFLEQRHSELELMGCVPDLHIDYDVSD